MRSLLLSSVAATALLAGLVGASAQQDQGRRGDPSASEQTQQPPRARGTVKEWPGSHAQQEQQRQAPARAQSERSTTGQSSERQADEPRTQREGRGVRDNARDRGPAARERTGEDRSRTPARERTTTGQSQQQRDVTRETPRRGERRQQRDTAQDRGSRMEQRQESTRQETTRQDRTTRGSVRMSDEQRTRVTARFSDRIDRMNVRTLSRSQISVSVGATVPRSVHLYTVPRDIVAIYPQFRGHRFVVVEDEIVIVEPRSHRIVTVLPMGGDRSMAQARPVETTGSAPAGSRVRISPQVREEIRTVVLREPACRLEQRLDFVLFIPVPRTVEVCELPPQIISDAPELRRYRYVVQGDEIGLIDPDENRIVEVIR